MQQQPISATTKAATTTSEKSSMRQQRVSLHLVRYIIDCAQARPLRPWSEFLKRPSPPIRENMMYRVYVNLFWHARNYICIIVCFVLLMVPFYHLFALMLLAPFAQALNSTAFDRFRSVWGLVQIFFLVVNYREYGFLPGALSTISCLAMVFGHAFFTPYTDEQSRLLETLLAERDVAVDMPSTPVIAFVPRTSAAAAAGQFPDVSPEKGKRGHQHHRRTSSQASNGDGTGGDVTQLEPLPPAIENASILHPHNPHSGVTATSSVATLPSAASIHSAGSSGGAVAGGPDYHHHRLGMPRGGGPIPVVTPLLPHASLFADSPMVESTQSSFNVGAMKRRVSRSTMAGA